MLTHPIISVLIQEPGGASVLHRSALPGSEITSESVQVPLADGTEGAGGVLRTLTLRLVADDANDAQLAAWVAALTPVDIVAETLGEVIIWQGARLRALRDGGQDVEARAVQATKADAF